MDPAKARLKKKTMKSTTNASPSSLAHDDETEVMAHRYLYYVLSEPVLHDLVYDVLERAARAVLPADSPVQRVGSSLPASYSPQQIQRAEALLQA